MKAPEAFRAAVLLLAGLAAWQSQARNFFVNDAVSTADMFCTAAGSDTLDGLSGNSPKATVQAIIDTYAPTFGDTIYVDAGTYLLDSDLVLPDTGAGGGPSNLWLSLVGAKRLTILDRQGAGAGSACIRVEQDFTSIDGITCRGAENGILVQPTSCRNASVAHCTLTGNSGPGLTILPDTTSEGFDTYYVMNNIVANNGGGIDLQSGTGNHLAYCQVANNAITVYNGCGIQCGGRPQGTTLKNNIVTAKNSGYCLVLASDAPLMASDYNDLFAIGGAYVAKWFASGTARIAATLDDWQSASGRDASSLSKDPLFASPADGDFHLRSTGGSWHGGAWLADSATSPCVDAGDPGVSVDAEPEPNGPCINMGAYGGTAEASHSAQDRALVLVYPCGGEVLSNGTLRVVWKAYGAGWQTEDTVRIEYSFGSDNAWNVLSGASALSPSGNFEWQLPNPSSATLSVNVRVVCNQSAAISDATVTPFVVLRRSAVYYVNDGSTAGDWYCTAAGSDTFDGTLPSRPFATLGELLKRVRLNAGDTVYVDTGLYNLSSNIIVDATHKGAAEAFIRIIGTRGGTVFNRLSNGSLRRCLEIHSDYLRLEGLAFTGGDNAMVVNASSARHLQLSGNICSNSLSFGVVVKPFSSIPGEEYQLLQNVVVGNGAGFSLEGATNRIDNRCLFIVENNTIVNGGEGVRILNTNGLGKRVNVLRNNIVEATNAWAACISALPGSLYYSDFNDLHPLSDGYVGAWITGSASQTGFTTLAAWRTACGQESHSLSAPPVFSGAASGNYRLKATSPCVDAGINSFWMFGAKDAGGMPRIAGATADLGAYELFSRANVRLYLQGPFLSSVCEMSNRLSTLGLIPLQSPYAEDRRTIASVPTNATDWVLMQFRGQSNGPALFSRSLLLRKDGWLMDVSGSTDLDINVPNDISPYLVVKHRNHLAAMSALPVTPTNATYAYDFTLSSDAYFGGADACVPVSTGNGVRFVFAAGDTDGDGAVLPVDLAIYNSLSVSGDVYRRTDANLDGALTTLDASRITENLGRTSPIPRPEAVLLPSLWISPTRKTLSLGESLTITGGSFSTDTSSSSGNTGGISLPDPLSWEFVHNRSDGVLAATGIDQALYTPGSYTDRTDVVEVWNDSEHLGRAQFNVMDAQTAASAGQAIIIAGRTSDSDTLWPTTDYLADNAYTTLRYRGFTKENLHYLSPEPEQDVDGDGNLDDIDGEATFAQSAALFTNAVSGTSHLFVYLVDHGGNASGEGYFRLSASETITAPQLDNWLDSLQDQHGTEVTVLLDFCYAGSFLSALTYGGPAKRLVIAACGTNQPSYFVAGGLVSFSGAFFSGVMLGYDVLECYDMAESAMSTYQSAMLDDDGDGTFTTGDGAVARGTYIGPTTVAAGDVPLIGDVCGNQILADQTSATLWIGGIASPYPISDAWCFIVPPGYNPNPDTPVTDLPRLDLTYDAATAHYTVTYDGFTAPGTYYVSFYVQDEEGNVSAPRSAYVAQIGYDDRVILVAGGDTNGPAWPGIDYLTRLAYSTLRLRLFTPDHIRVLSADPTADFDRDGTNDVAGLASLANLDEAINVWATTQSTDRLTLYFIGEGTNDTFRISPVEGLSTNALASWVHDYQTTNPIPVNVLLDFSGAGAFLPSLADPELAENHPEATRISIASAGAGREALFANGGTVSFSQYLLSGIITGSTLGDAYTAARRAIRRVSGNTRQRAQIDDNLNGEASEKQIDGLLADETYIGSSFVTGADAPVIGAVMPPLVLESPGTAVTVWASGVTGMYPISNVWCAVTPPGFTGAADLMTLALSWSTNALRYELSTASFISPGSYNLTFYAQDTQGQISSPMQSEIILADAYEPDDTTAHASFYDGAPQTHTFHTAQDMDWVRVYMVTNFIYDIETYPLSAQLDTVVDFYRQEADGSLTLLDHVDEEGSEDGEYTGIDYPASGWYWARVSPFSEGTNTLGTYELSISIPAAAGVNTLIVLGLDDVYASALPTGATATVQGHGSQGFNGSASVVYPGLTNGTYLVTVPVPDGFIPREDPYTPGQVQSLTNLFYANPREVVVEGGWKMAGFEMLSTVSVTSGVVRDAWTHAYLDNAEISFTASSGSITGAVATGNVILTDYCSSWTSAADGAFPSDIVLGACNWHLSVTRTGYQGYTALNAVSNLQTGAGMEAGTVYLTPVDANANQVADSWEALYFPGGMDPDEDSDGDGLSNKAEYLCGTDPTNTLSVLRITRAEPGADALNLNWSVIGGRRYEVLSVTSLTDLASITTNGPWEASHGQQNMEWSDTNAPALEARFYRVQLTAPGP